MATTVTLNGSTYSIPAVREARNWGQSLTNYLIAISTVTLQKSGGAFTLTADANFGASKGLITLYLKSYTANAAGTISTAGIIRLGNAESIGWKNVGAGNSELTTSASDRLTFGAVNVPTISSTDTFTNKSIDADTNTLTNIENADIKASAAIDATKIANGTVNNTEFQYLSNVSSDIQTQFAAKAPLASPTLVTPRIDDYLDINEESAPATPSAGMVRVYAKTDKKVYKKTSDGVESEVGSGGSGGVNYITNPDAEGNATTGWATYADAAATTPVDGTAGSANITFTATSSSPLRGTYSFLITKDAANRQGQGVSYDFTIAAADKGRPLGISWEGEASSGYTGSSSTEYLVCYVYDVTNATLIATSNVNVAAGSSKGFTTFLATTSTSYRLIFHVASTGTVAWTYKMDSVKVSPEIAVQGAAVSDWKQWTPTFSAGLGTVTADKMYWRQAGDTIEISGNFTCGTTAGSGATFTLPNGYTNDSSKRSATSNPRAGRWQRGNNTINTRKAGVLLTDAAGSNLVYFGSDDYAAAVSPASGQNGNTLFSNSDIVWVDNCVIPITGWSSNVTMANRALERYFYTTEAFAATGSTTAEGFSGQATTNNAGTEYTKTITHNMPGAYPLLELSTDSGVNWVPADGIASRSYSSAGAGIGCGISAMTSTTVTLSFGGYKVMANDDSPTTDWGTGFRWRVKMTASGAAVGFPISPANLVKSLVRYSSNTAQPMTAAGEVIDYEDKDFDTKNEVTTGAAWVFTAKEAGYYRVNASAMLTSTAGWVAGEYFGLIIRKNGATSSDNVAYQTAAHSTFVYLQGADLMYLGVGGTIDVTLYNNNGTDPINRYGLSGYNVITIEQVG